MSANSIEYKAESIEATRALGQLIGRSLESGLLIALEGTLGAGKTNLVQSIAEGLQVARSQVVSPTFTLIQVHQGRLPLVHIDAYRIADEDQYIELGIDDFFDGTHVVAMEWAEKFDRILPEDRLAIEIEVAGSEQRVFRVSRHGDCESAAKVLDAISRL